MEKRRRTAAVLAASLAAHALLFGAWLTKRALVGYVEPPPIQVELLRPRKPERPKPTPRPQPRSAGLAGETLHLPPVLAQPATPAVPAQKAPLDPRQMTDQELLERAGPKPNVAKLFEEEARRPVFSRRLPPGPYDCKPASEHSDRIAPPCPTYAGRPPPSPFGALPNRSDLAAQAAAKGTAKAYGERYGPNGMPSANDYPSLRCRLAGTHCGPGDPDMDSLRPH